MDTEEKEVKKKAKMVAVRALDVNPTSALVEWVRDGVPKRGYIPTGALLNEQVSEDTLSSAIPYGLPWEELAFPSPTGAQVAVALRNAGIWTQADLFARPAAAIGALQSIFALHLGSLIEFAGKGD